MCTVLRKCLDCGLEANAEEDLSMFQAGSSGSKYGRQNLCYECGKNRAAKYRVENLDVTRKRAREWASNNKESRKNYRLQSKYGITLKQYGEILLMQEHRCKICYTHADDLDRGLLVDHCHTNGHVRGLLCDDCNKSLGYMKDNIDNFLNAIEYLTDNGREVDKEVNKKKNEMGI